MDKNILAGIDNYYTSKIKEHGATFKGVDWNSKESQYLRFAQLAKIIKDNKVFSILDYGCGVGDLVIYLQQNFPDANIQYTGFDISLEMIKIAQFKHANSNNINVQFTASVPTERFDYCMASGIFNVKLELADTDTWNNYIMETIEIFDQIAYKGFSFNALTEYSDKEYMKDYLFYANPLGLFDHCKRKYSRNVALLHDYGLYEFTMLIRKDG